MYRRKFLELGATLSAAIFIPAAFGGTKTCKDAVKTTRGSAKKFRLKFAPRNQLFSSGKNRDPLKRLDWLADNGFTAVEGISSCNPDIPPSQEKIERQIQIGKKLAELGFEVGGCSAMNDPHNPIMTGERIVLNGKKICGRNAVREILTRRMEATFGVIKRFGCDTFNIGAGTCAAELPSEKQFENAVENLQFCADYCATHGFKLTIEPLNTTTHPNIYCSTALFGAKMLEAINRPNIGLIYDVFHETMQTGNLASLDNPNVWNRISYFHFADSPTRLEPFTGTIDFVSLCKKLLAKGWNGIIGLEHGKSVKTEAGDEKVLAEYKKIDAALG